jgi:cytoskeletal protein RodZ
MKTIGVILREARMSKGYTLGKVESAIKIKKDFLDAIERENWSQLPDFPVTSGFVKNYADYLGYDKNGAVALLRRDYPPRKLSINPKPDVEKRFVINPKITFAAGILVVVLGTITYLGIQYAKYIRAPKLELSQPVNEQLVTENKLTVLGSTDIDATVTVNNQPVLTDEEGRFAVQLIIVAETKEIIVVAKSRAGKETIVRRNIKPEL